MFFLYDESGAPIGMQYRTETMAEGDFDYFYYEKDLLGNVIGVYNESGYKLIEYSYDAWGNCKYTYKNGGGSTGAQYNPFRYRGYYYDSDMGFYYLNDRYYDSITGRFLTPDDPSYLGANSDLLSYNLYAYCSNNPVMYVDPTGHSIIGILIILGAATIIGAAGAGIHAYKNEDKRGWGLVGEIFKGAAVGLSIGGAIVSLGAVGSVVFGGLGAAFMTVPAAQAFAIGALAFNVVPFILMPLLGEEAEGMEAEKSTNIVPPVQPTPPHPAWH